MTYTRSDTKKPKANHLQAKIARILESKVDRDLNEPVYRCHVCKDTGWTQITAGFKATIQSGVTIAVPERGPGVEQRCSGYQGQPCRYRQWRKEEAVKHKTDTKPSGEDGSL